jgi:hypothetical protein
MLSYIYMRRAKTILEKKHISIAQKYPNIAKVAYTVQDKLAKGEKINKRAIAVSAGYSIASAKSSKPFTSKAYQQINQIAIDKMLIIRDKALENINKRNLAKESLYDVVNVSKLMTHDTQLLQGKATENNNVVPQVIVFGSNDFLALQMAKNKEIKEAHYKEIEGKEATE